MHGSSQPLRPLLDSISERIQQQETRQMWNFPHPESLHPATVSFLVYLQILARLSQNSSCSAARCNFSSLCGSAQRGLGENLASKRAWKSISCGFHLLHIQSLWAPCDQHYGSVLRWTWSSMSSKPAWLFPPRKMGWPSYFISNCYTSYDFPGKEAAVLLRVELPALVKH